MEVPDIFLPDIGDQLTNILQCIPDHLRHEKAIADSKGI